MRTLVKFLLLAATAGANHALASDDALPPVPLIAPSGAAGVVIVAGGTDPTTWERFNAGASGSIILVGGGDIGLGTTRPPGDGGSIALPPGGQIVLGNPGGISISGAAVSNGVTDRGGIVTGILSTPVVGGYLVAASVPEPATPAMLLAGLGLLAAVRRKSVR